MGTEKTGSTEENKTSKTEAGLNKVTAETNTNEETSSDTTDGTK